jgi:hypothetical protein
MLPKLLDNGDAFRGRLFALDDFLLQIQDASMRVARNEGLTVDTRKQAYQKASDVHTMRELIGSPLRIDSAEDPRLLEVPVGTPFYWNGKQWRFTSREDQEYLRNLRRGAR